MFGAYFVARDHHALLWWFPLIRFCQGVFGLFTMYLPPLFPDNACCATGAVFFPNIGRAISAAGVVFFGLFSRWAITGWRCSMPDFCSCPPPQSPS